MRLSGSANNSIDYQLLGLTITLTLFGLVILTSASSVLGYERFGDTYFFTKQQAVHILLGFVALAGASFLPASFWSKIALPGFIVTLILLILVFIPGLGVSVHNSRSWVSIGPLNFQPSEFAKLGFLLYIATWLVKRREHLREISFGLFPFLILLGTLTSLILLQPDVGTMSLIILTAVALYFIAGARLNHLLVVGGIVLSMLAFVIMSASYRQDRFLVLFDPARDPSGVGYHIRQATIAIGSGGWWGKGLGKSRQKYNYLPEAAGDSIFAVMGEELGFVFTTVFIGALAALVARLWHLARYAPTDIGKFMIAGVALWISFQSLFNLGAMIGVFPLTGLPLPFVSFGGSAIFTLLFAIGICISFSRQKI